jgi:hypothetical protein
VREGLGRGGECWVLSAIGFLLGYVPHGEEVPRTISSNAPRANSRWMDRPFIYLNSSYSLISFLVYPFR